MSQKRLQMRVVARYAVVGPDLTSGTWPCPRPEDYRFATLPQALEEARTLHGQFKDVFLIHDWSGNAVGRFPEESLPCRCHPLETP